MSDVTIQPATRMDAAVIHRLAHEIWWPTYGDLLPHAQIRFMLKNNYAIAALKQQMVAGQQFALATSDGQAVGFIGFQQKPADDSIMRIEKLYVHPSQQGKGTGKKLIDHVGQLALAAGISYLELNVYRHNPAKIFYERQGFVIVESVQIPYHGYLLDDYIMRKQLS